MTIRRTAAFAVVLASLFAVLVSPHGTRTAAALRTEPSAKASITFEVSSGVVTHADQARTPVAVASTIKLFTALVAKNEIPMNAQVPITAQAADVSPLKLTMEPGSSWRATDLLHAMLIASLNDTAMALAIEAGGGSLAGFHRVAIAQAKRLGLADRPIIKDPSGLDGTEGVDGGNLISARDLAIVTRAFLSDPELAEIVRLGSYHFDGGDGRPHVVYNHNAFLTIYPGAIGVKTGYTDRSGHSLVAAATREGRTFATVVIDSPDPVGFATAQLDAAFAAPTDSPGTGDVLPEPKIVPDPETTTTRPPTTTAVVAAQTPPVEASGSSSWTPLAVMTVVFAGFATLIFRARRRLSAGIGGSRRDGS